MLTGNSRYFLFFAAAVLLMLFTLLKGVSSMAQPPPRPAITGTIMLRDGQTVTLNCGSQDGLRKGDKLQVSHSVNGKMVPSGRLVVTRVYGTNAEARVTEQTGVVGPEDVVTLDTSVPVPVPKPTPKPSEPTRQTSKPSEPTREPTRKTPKTPVQTPPKEPINSEPIHEVVSTLPLLPQFSTDKAGGASFTFDFTNENPKPFDTAVYRSSAHLIFDGEDYRMLPMTQGGPDLLESGKKRTFSFALTDFTVSKDMDVWPLKSGRHTALIKFGGKQFGPLTFDWRGDTTAQPSKPE
jgi:outer membrane biosynthesis protein TonB